MLLKVKLKRTNSLLSTLTNVIPSEGEFVYSFADKQAVIGDGTTAISSLPRLYAKTWKGDIISAAYGGTGNSSGYIRQGLKSGVTAGSNSTAEGTSTSPTGNYSHAEGYTTVASGSASHAEGSNTTASGTNSSAIGTYTIANHKSQHVFGEYNASDPSSNAATARGTYVEIVGKGTSTSARSNARTLDWDGNEALAGNLTPMVTNSSSLGTSSYRWSKVYVGNANTYGSTTVPIYWNDGVPTAISSLSLNTTGSAASATTATKLATARLLKVNLASTSTVTFDGSADLTSIPVTGTLPVANGGTGNTSAIANRLVWSSSATKLEASNHYVSTTKVAIASTAAPTQTFYVNGTAAFKLSSSSNPNSLDKNFTILGKTMLLSLGPSGILSYSGANYDTPDDIYMAGYGGNVILASNTYAVRPHDNNLIPLGTTSYRWSKVYIGSANSYGDAGTPIYWNDGVPTAISTLSLNTTGSAASAATATKLATARKINGTSFNGTADITTTKWGTARNITIGNTAKSVDGSAAVSWTNAEIGATVSNTWTAGTSSGPTLKTTVNGVDGTAVSIPSASSSASGVVTTGSQTFAGAKTFTGITSTKKLNITSTDAETSNGGHISFSRTGANYIWAPETGTINLGNNSTINIANSTAIINSDSVYPGTTNTVTLGTASAKWSKVYVGTANTYGSATKGVYWNDGVPAAMTYSLSATVNSGTANQVAYYSGANAISSKAPAWAAWTAGTTAGPKANIQIGNATYTSAAIPSASMSASGIITSNSTTEQHFSGPKAFNRFYLYALNDSNEALSTVDIAGKNSSGNLVATLFYSFADSTDYTKVTHGQWNFKGWSPKSTADTAPTSKYETYVLPEVTVGRTSNATYDIYTSKPGLIVAVANGGTGLSASPSVLVNLASTSAANILAASPRPGVTGILPVANGGTGNATGLAASVSKALTFDNSGNGVSSGTTYNGSTARTISYNTIGAAASSHTHNYAGSSSAGGAATTALKWDAAQKVYVNLASASTTTTIQGGSTSALVIGVSGTLAITNGGTGNITGQAASVSKALTFNNGGSGADSGTTYNGSAARTISYNTVGAAAAGHTHNYAGSSSAGGAATTALKWDAAQKVYVTLGTASTTTTIQGGSTNAQTIGVNGTLGTANGGTGKTSYTTNGVLYASSTSALSQATASDASLILIANSNKVPTWTDPLATLNTSSSVPPTSSAVSNAIGMALLNFDITALPTLSSTYIWDTLLLTPRYIGTEDTMISFADITTYSDSSVALSSLTDVYLPSSNVTSWNSYKSKFLTLNYSITVYTNAVKTFDGANIIYTLSGGTQKTFTLASTLTGTFSISNGWAYTAANQGSQYPATNSNHYTMSGNCYIVPGLHSTSSYVVTNPTKPSIIKSTGLTSGSVDNWLLHYRGSGTGYILALIYVIGNTTNGFKCGSGIVMIKGSSLIMWDEYSDYIDKDPQIYYSLNGWSTTTGAYNAYTHGISKSGSTTTIRLRRSSLDQSIFRKIIGSRIGDGNSSFRLTFSKTVSGSTIYNIPRKIWYGPSTKSHRYPMTSTYGDFEDMMFIDTFALFAEDFTPVVVYDDNATSSGNSATASWYPAISSSGSSTCTAITINFRDDSYSRKEFYNRSGQTYYYYAEY